MKALLVWFVLGVLVALASVSLLFLIPLLILPAVWLVLRRTEVGWAWPASLIGVGAVGVYIAAVQVFDRCDPGALCSGEGLDPLPWVIGGAILILVGGALLRGHAPRVDAA